LVILIVDSMRSATQHSACCVPYFSNILTMTTAIIEAYDSLSVLLPVEQCMFAQVT